MHRTARAEGATVSQLVFVTSGPMRAPGNLSGFGHQLRSGTLTRSPSCGVTSPNSPRAGRQQG